MAATTLTIESIYTKHHNTVLAYISWKLNGVSICEEIANDVFLKANRLLASFDSERSNIKTWLFTIANSAIIDYYRTNHSDKFVNVSKFADAETGKEIFQFVGSKSIEANFEVENNELSASINKAFQKLNPTVKEVSELFFIEGKKYEEIAELLSIPMGSVKGYINRARTILQNELVSERKAFA